MSRTFDVYVSPTHSPVTGGRPGAPTFEPQYQLDKFHSNIPSLTAQETRIVDKVLAYGATIHEVSRDMERMFLTPTKRRVNPRTPEPEEAAEARKKRRQGPELPIRPRSLDLNIVEHLAAPSNPYLQDYPYLDSDVDNLDDYTAFRLKSPQKPKPKDPKGSMRAPLTELPRDGFMVRPRRPPVDILTLRTQTSSIGSPLRRGPRYRASAMNVQRIPTARFANPGCLLNPVTPPAQSAQARSQVTPSTSNSSQSSVCSSCGWAYVCPHCSPQGSIQSSTSTMPSTSSSGKLSSSHLQVELDRDVRKMMDLAAKGRKLRDIIPSMAPLSGGPKARREKTEVEKWLEKEMAS